MRLLTEIVKPEISFTLESVPVVAETRKLRAVWSPQLEQNIRAFQHIDTVAKIEQCLVDQMSVEIDRQIIEDILGGINCLNEIVRVNQGVKWNDLQFPIVKQIHSKTISQDLVEVKPMSAPQGLMFYMDYIGPERKLKYIFLIPEKKQSKNQKVWALA